MKWINGGGGPLICSEEYISVRWKGTDGLSGNSGYRNDYEKAGSTQEYVEKIVCADGYVLVLGDEPAQSIFFELKVRTSASP
jgi:hypothetical protein